MLNTWHKDMNNTAVHTETLAQLQSFLAMEGEEGFFQSLLNHDYTRQFVTGGIQKAQRQYVDSLLRKTPTAWLRDCRVILPGWCELERLQVRTGFSLFIFLIMKSCWDVFKHLCVFALTFYVHVQWCKTVSVSRVTQKQFKWSSFMKRRKNTWIWNNKWR